MSNVPPDYIKATSFTTLATQPITISGLPGSQLDSEFTNVSETVNQTIDRLSLVQKDDGSLRSKVVTIDSLSPETAAAITTAGARISGEWAVGAKYVPGDVIIYGADNYAYICAVTHTASANFESDFSAKAWAILGYRPPTNDLVVKTFTGDGSTLTFSLGINPVSENNTQVFVSGVYRSKSTYSISGTNLVFSAGNAPANASPIEVVIGVPAELISNVVTIPNNSVGTSAIIDLNVTGAKIADGTITTGKLADQSVTSDKIENNAVGSTKITDLSIGTDKLAGGAVTTTKIAPGAVIVSSIADLNVTTAKIADSNVTTAKIADLNVTTAKIADDAVTSDKIALGAIIPNLPSNFPIQIVGATKTDVQTITGSVSTWVDVSGLSVTLTRSSLGASGKVRIQANISSTSNNASHAIAYRIMRNSSTVIGVGNADGLRSQVSANTGYNGGYANNPGVIDFIDTSPGGTSSVSYKIQAKCYSNITGYINRIQIDDNDGNYSFRSTSSITLTELT